MYRARSSKNCKNCRILFEYKDGVQFVVCDTETTGLNPDSDYIVEFAAKKYQIINRKMVLIEELDLFIRPPIVMDEKVVKIHKITNEQLKNHPPEQQCIHQIINFMGKNPIVVGKHIEFDISMIKSMYLRCGFTFNYRIAIDIEDMARDLLDRSETGDYQLHTLAALYGVDKGITFHNALADVEATARLLYCFYLEYTKLPQISTQKQKIYVNAMYFWKGNNSKQQGIWLRTNLDDEGKIFFSTLDKAWHSSKIDLSKYDIDELERYCLSKTGLSISEFGKLTEKKFKELRQKRRKEGVYL